MKVKSFRISEENSKELKRASKDFDKSEGHLINQALDRFFKSLEPKYDSKGIVGYGKGILF